MRSKLRSCPFRGWLNLALCSFVISVCFFSCTISIDVGATEPVAPTSIQDRLCVNPWAERCAATAPDAGV